MLSACSNLGSENINYDEIKKGYSKEIDGLMFQPDTEGDIYNDCPSVFEEDGIRYVYYCTNTDDGQIIDYIGCRKAVNIDGEYTDILAIINR